MVINREKITLHFQIERVKRGFVYPQPTATNLNQPLSVALSLWLSICAIQANHFKSAVHIANLNQPLSVALSVDIRHKKTAYEGRLKVG